MREAYIVTTEILMNQLMIYRLAYSDLLIRTKGTLLGWLWIWINPAFQIFIYGVVFGQGLRLSKPVEGVEFFYWLSAGFIMWTYISGTIGLASRSILSKIGIITKMRFPISVTPVVVVINNLYIHFLMLITVVIILVFSGFPITKHYILLIYYIFSATCFLIAISILTSAITTIVKDFQHIVYNFMRMMFFVTPILFPEQNLTGILGQVAKYNPFVYLISGYRDCLVLQRATMFKNLQMGLYFWGVTLVIYIIGCILHVRMRKKLLDYA